MNEQEALQLIKELIESGQLVVFDAKAREVFDSTELTCNLNGPGVQINIKEV